MMLRRAFLRTFGALAAAATGFASSERSGWWIPRDWPIFGEYVDATEAPVGFAIAPTYLGTERIDGVDWHLWEVPNLPRNAFAELPHDDSRGI